MSPNPSIPSKRTSPPLSNSSIPSKKFQTSSAHHLIAFPSTGSNAMYDLEEELLPRRVKGKEKQRVMPELPESVWMRIFELHYEDIAEEWHQTYTLHHALTPLLLSKDLTSAALPMLYCHPVISYHTISSFLRSLSLPSRYTHLTKVAHVRHLTIRPTPAIPNLELKRDDGGLRRTTGLTLNRSVPYTVHTLLPAVLGLFQELITFTLKDTLILHQADAGLLFKALKLIRPKKARLEIRMWDLYDCAVGQDLISATMPSIHTPTGKTSSVSSSFTHRSINDGSRQQEAWRDALFKGGEFELPSWWIAPPSGDEPLLPRPPHRRIRNAALDGGRRLGNANSSSAPPALPPASHSIHAQPAPNPDVAVPFALRDSDHLHSDSSDSESSMPRATITSAPAAAGNGVLSRRDDPLQRPSTEHDSDGGFTILEHMPENDESSTPFNAGRPVASLRARLDLQSILFDNSLASGRTSSPNHSQVAVNPSSISNRRPSPPADRPRSRTSSVLTEAQRTKTDHLYIPPDETVDHSPTGSSATRSQSTINGWTAAFSATVSATVPPPNTTVANHPERARLVSGPRSSRTPTKPRDRGQSAEETELPGLTSYSLAHHVRGLLLDLLQQVWTPRLQALSMVAFDPLASLIVRSPQLDFWTRIPVPHIRVHLPRGCNSLAVFKGAKETARDRLRNRNEAYGRAPHLDMNESEEDASKIVGGNGMGGDLMNENTTLFEIEVNTIAEMSDDVWTRCGDQLPPQICRILVGEQDWRDVQIGSATYTGPTTSERGQTVSPSTSDFDSPTFTPESNDSDEVISNEGFELAGDTYDAKAAEEQLRKMREREGTAYGPGVGRDLR